MYFLRRAIPSMFHRRLALLMLVIVLSMAVLWGQLLRLTVVRGAALLEEAEQKLISYQTIPTVRGRILDRLGRELAVDRPCFDIRVDYRVITGQWSYEEAARAAARDLSREGRSIRELSLEQRENLIAQYRTPFDDQLEQLWRTLASAGGIDRQEIEQRRTQIIERVQSIRSEHWGNRQIQRSRELKEVVSLDEVAESVREEKSAHTILPAVSDEVEYEIRKLLGESQLPGVRIERAKVREYHHENLALELDAAHLPSALAEDKKVRFLVRQPAATLIGSMRDVWAEDVERRPYRTRDGKVDPGGYLPEDDSVGSTGIEAAEEDTLRGLRGLIRTHHETGQTDRVAPVPGQDVQITIDIQLQARIMAIMDPRFNLMRVQPWHQNKDTDPGTPLFGAAIVMEVQSGEILAMVSTPVPPAPTPGKPYPDLRLDPNMPHLNKAYQAVYEPGSTFKPIIYALAASKGAVQHDQVIACKGHFLDNRQDILRCWIYRPEYYNRTHGPLGPIVGIARSCNIYFMTCGDRLGPVRLVDGLRDFGFLSPTGFGLSGEEIGLSKDPSDPATARKMDNELIDAMMGIGQGVAVPPIQIAAGHAALARGGVYLSPTLVHGRPDRQVRRDLKLPGRVLDNIGKGMYESANNMDIGTASYIRMPPDDAQEKTITFPSVTVRAKTGTAQTPPQYPLKIRLDADGRETIVPDLSARPLRDGTHSWYVLTVAKPSEKQAAYVVVVMVEYGGSGGKVAGPVANQILFALRDEGYL